MSGTVHTFNSGTGQTFVVPDRMTRIWVQVGADWLAEGFLSVTPAETLQVNVADGAGKASDIRQGGVGLANRKIVAGGRGLGGYAPAGGGGTGGTGGRGGGSQGSQGGNGSGPEYPSYRGYGGAGGSQTYGPNGGSGEGPGQNGTLGFGGGGGNSSYASAAGGKGGDGYYGGGGGGATGAYAQGSGGGGGGSSYIGGVTDGVMRAPTSGEQNKIVIIENSDPNTPTPLTPATGATISNVNTQRFSWATSDPDSGDSQAAYNFYYRAVGAASWLKIARTTPNTFWDSPAATFPEDDYEWQVETFDNFGGQSPRSASSFFTAQTPPTGPTWTAPTSGSSVNASVTATWSVPQQDAYQFRRMTDLLGEADSLIAGTDTGTVYEPGTRAIDITFDTNRTEHLQVRSFYDGLWSPWADITITVVDESPSTPVVTLTVDDDEGSLIVGISNPAPGSGETGTVYNEVWIDDSDEGNVPRVTDWPTDTAWTYWKPYSTVDYDGRVRVVAVAANGMTAEGAT